MRKAKVLLKIEGGDEPFEAYPIHEYEIKDPKDLERLKELCVIALRGVRLD